MSTYLSALFGLRYVLVLDVREDFEEEDPRSLKLRRAGDDEEGLLRSGGRNDD